MFTTQPKTPRPRAAGRLRRAIALLMSLTLVAGSLVCPAPGLAHEAPAHGDHSAIGHSHGHEHEHGGAGAADHEADLCCDILGHVDAAVGAPDDPQKHASLPDHAPWIGAASILIVASRFDEAVSLIRHGPAPPPPPWPQFSKIRSHAPPADHA